MNGLTNSRLGMEVFLNIMDEFRNFIGGGGSNQNLFSFLDNKNADEAELIEALREFAPPIDKDDPDKEFELLKRNLFFPLLDNMLYAYSIKDIVSDVTNKKIFPNVPEGVDLSKYMHTFYENAAGFNFYGSSLPLYDFSKDGGGSPSEIASVIKMVTPVTTKFQSKVLKDFRNDADFKKENKEGKKVPIVGNFATSTNSADVVHINGGSVNAAPPDSNRYASPALGAFTIRRPDLGIMTRNADPINIFFNAVTPLEMSRCTPYINVAVVTLQDEVRPKKMNNVTFMRFIKGSTDGSYILDENIGIQKAKPYGYDIFSSLFDKNRIDAEMLSDVSLMDIFASTQMASNANINGNNESLKNTGMGRNVLEPISPFLTLNSVSVDISGMGIALFSSKVASMEITLHDRSRLSDIAPLVSPNQFGMTKVILEYGWSHPEGGISSQNRVGQFLNSARDRSIFTVKSSNFNFSDGNTVKVSLSLACYGADESKSISAAAGSQIPLTIFKPTIKKMLQDIVERKEGAKNKDKGKNLRLREVRHLVNVAQRNAVSTDSLITYEEFTNAINLYKETLKFGADKELPKARAKFVSAIGGLLGNNLIKPGSEVDKKQLQQDLKDQKDEETKNATQLLYGKLTPLTDALSEELGKTAGLSLDPMLASVCDWADGLKVGAESNTSKNVSLGKVMMSFIGHSLAMSGMFDEVQMFFYPLNVKAGKARVHTTASLPINKKKLKKVIAKKVASDASISVNTVFNLIERKILRDAAFEGYGVAGIEKEYADAKEASKKKVEEAGDNKDKKQQAIDARKLAREQRKSSITAACAKFYSSDGGPTVENEFVRPNLSLYIETLPCMSADESLSSASMTSVINVSLPGANISVPRDVKTWNKNICRVHIYDEEAVSKPFESFLNSMITEGGGGKIVSSAVSTEKRYISYLEDEDVDPAVLDTIEANSLETKLKRYSLRVTPDKIKAAIKRGYPSVTYGASTGVVKSMSISSNVSNQVSQVILISSNADTRNAQKEKEGPTYEEMEVVPASVSLEMLGCPYIQRGNQIYIDFGTNTTLDNIYTVKSVKHNLTAGDFSTSVELIFTGQGKVSNIRSEIAAAISSIT